MRASDVIKHRLRTAARRLGARDPLESLGGVIERSFDLPLGDPRYGNNSLAPGFLPIEHSFSELTPQALRLDMELAGPTASPFSRREETSREVRRIVHQHYGRPALRFFDERSEGWRTGSISGRARYGAFFGAAFDEQGPVEVKSYYEMEPDQVNALPPNLQHAVRVAIAALPGLQPIFTSVACGRARGAQRVYLFHPGELRLLDLEPLMHQLGIGQQLPSVLAALGVITGGRFTLPAGSTVIGLRDTPRGMEMKLEILLPAFTDPPEQMHGLIQLHLAQRPEAQRALRQWMQAMTPDDAEGPGDMSVVGVRVNPDLPARLNIYFRPNEARPRTNEVAADRAASRRSVGGDPYAQGLRH